MNKRYNTKILLAFLLAMFVLFSATSSFGNEYDSIVGIKSVKAIYDFRVANPKVAAVHLDLIYKTFNDPNLMVESKKPEFVIVFMGPAVKLVSKDRDDFAAEDQKHLDTIAGVISKMAKDGVKLEICVAAVHLTGGDPEAILPEIKQVGNGWISSIGYQHKGYALIPDF